MLVRLRNIIMQERLVGWIILQYQSSIKIRVLINQVSEHKI